MLPDIGFGELLVIAVVVLLVGKPEDLPVVMRKLGIWSAHLQHYIRGITAGWQEGMDSVAEDVMTAKPSPRAKVRKPKTPKKAG